MKSILDKSFVYTDAAESSKPGYLQRKFDQIRAEQAREAKAEADRIKAEKVSKVRQITKPTRRQHQ